MIGGMARTYTTQPKRKLPATSITVDGRTLRFQPPDPSGLLLAVADAQSDDEERQANAVVVILDWLGGGLSDEDGKWILTRLRDPLDEFNVEDAMAIVMALIEDITGRPTTPPSDFSASSPQPSSTGGRPVDPSTPETSPSPDYVISSITS
jgi:hypothetical protein